MNTLARSKPSALHAAESKHLRIVSPDPIHLFGAQIAFAPSGSQPPKVTRPGVAGRTYRVQFKNELRDASWFDLDCSISIMGDQAQATDVTPRPAQRFYRIITF